MISNDAPIMDMTQAILLAEFQNGAWNPDLMLMLVEPLTYMFIALAERLDLEPVIYLGEMEDEDTEEQILGVSFQEEKINEMKKAAQSGKVPAGIISAEMEASLPSLPEVEIPEEQPVQAQPSLMAAPQQGI
jgi:ribosome-binding ATPase YchF (GTP1/OBG family)